jgi:hypothetical protein
MAPSMRWIRMPCAFVTGAVAAVSIAAAGCGFSAPSVGPSGDARTPDGGGDAAIADGPPDSRPPDGPPPVPIHTRRIDITDALVIGGPHTDFPLLVSITAPWLRPTSAGGDVASPSGFDLGFFADAAGTTRLAHEVEAYRSDAGNGNGALLAWVKVPSLAPTSELYLRYGDPAITASQESIPAVWSNGFAAVWHLGALGDSTANANNGTNGGTAAIGGQIGEARNFDATNDFIAVGSGASIDDIFTGGGAIEAWFRASGFGEAQKGRILEKGDNSTGETSGWYLSVDNDNTTSAILFGHASTGGTRLGAWNTPASSVTLNAWTHVAVVYDKSAAGNTPSIFINGAPLTLTSRSSPGGSMVSDAAHSARVGNRGAGDRTFNGRLDEVRLSRAARSPGWIATSYRNQLNPGAFYTVSDPL